MPSLREVLATKTVIYKKYRTKEVDTFVLEDEDNVTEDTILELFMEFVTNEKYYIFRNDYRNSETFHYTHTEDGIYYFSGGAKIVMSVHDESADFGRFSVFKTNGWNFFKNVAGEKARIELAEIVQD